MRIRKNGRVVRLTESDLRRITKRVISEQESLGIKDKESLKKLAKYLRSQRDEDVNFSIEINIGELTSDLFFKGAEKKKDTDFRETVSHTDLVSILPFVLGLTDTI